MIEFIDLDKSMPVSRFLELYTEAINKKQTLPEAVCISSLDSKKMEIDSRLVNLKYILKDEWIFFSNYNSPKAKQFYSHEQISANFFWESINTQIRIKARIRKSNPEFSDYHFKKRTKEKNALAIISSQSTKTASYEEFCSKYDSFMRRNDIDLFHRPDYWGGFSFVPYFFEFWTGHKDRLNKREEFSLINNKWKSSILEP